MKNLQSRTQRIIPIVEDDHYVKLPSKTRNIPDYVKKWLQRLDLQPIESHTQESFKSVRDSLEKFNQIHSYGRGQKTSKSKKSIQEEIAEICKNEEKTKLEIVTDKQSIFQRAVSLLFC